MVPVPRPAPLHCPAALHSPTCVQSRQVENQTACDVSPCDVTRLSQASSNQHLRGHRPLPAESASHIKESNEKKNATDLDTVDNSHTVCTVCDADQHAFHSFMIQSRLSASGAGSTNATSASAYQMATTASCGATDGGPAAVLCRGGDQESFTEWRASHREH